jgi:hypothetical protein
MKNIELYIHPRTTVTPDQFLMSSPDDNATAWVPRNNNNNSITLDGYMSGGPNLWRDKRIVNFDHHDNVVRSATMSTCKQVYLAIKQGLFEVFEGVKPYVYINDVDQDTALAVWLLENHHLFEASSSIPNINRLVSLTDMLDITAGSFPMNLNDDLTQTHCWVFKPYSDFRTSGLLSNATTGQMAHNLEETMGRISQMMMGEAGKCQLDTRHEIFWKDDIMTIVDEIGGNDARYYLYSKGMKAHISLVSTRSDGRYVWSVGKQSPYIPFDIREFFTQMNLKDKLPNGDQLPANEQAGGSDLIGGSSRLHGSALTWEDMREIYLSITGI